MRQYISACATMACAIMLTSCQEKTVTPEDIVASSTSRPGRDAAMLAPANWFVVPGSAQLPLLVSGTEGPQRIVRVEPQSGYTVAIVDFDCSKGIHVQQSRTAQRDAGRPVVSAERDGVFGADTHLRPLCEAPDGYRRIRGTLFEAMTQVRQDAGQLSPVERGNTETLEAKGAVTVRERRLSTEPGEVPPYPEGE